MNYKIYKSYPDYGERGKFFIMSFVGDMLVDAGWIYTTDIPRLIGRPFNESEAEELDLLGKEYKYRVKNGLYYRIVVSKAGLVFVEKYEHNQLTASDFTGLSLVPTLKCGLTINKCDDYNIEIILWQTYLSNKPYCVSYSTSDLEVYNTMETYTIDSKVDFSCESYDAKRVSPVSDVKFAHIYRNSSNELQVAHLYKDWLFDSESYANSSESEEELPSLYDYMLLNEGLKKHSDEFYVYTFRRRYYKYISGVDPDTFCMAVYYKNLLFIKLDANLFWRKNIETLENKAYTFDSNIGFRPLADVKADLYYGDISIGSFLSIVPYLSSICTDRYDAIQIEHIIKAIISEGDGNTFESSIKLLGIIDFPVLSSQVLSEEVKEEMRQLDEKEIEENGTIVVPLAEEYNKIVTTALYRVINLENLEIKTLTGIQVQGIGGKLISNVKDDIIYPVSFCNREWCHILSAADNSHVRILVTDEGFVFLERYENEKIVASGYTGIMLNKKSSFIGVEDKYLVYGHMGVSQTYYIPSDRLYSSTFKNCCEYDFNSKPDMLAIPYSDAKVRNRYRRMAVVNPNIPISLKRVYDGVEYPIESKVNGYKMKIILDNEMLLSYESITADEHKELLDSSNTYDCIHLGAELAGVRILAEDTAYFIVGSKHTDMYILYHEGKVFISEDMFVWDKVYHGGNKVRFLYTSVSKQKTTARILSPHIKSRDLDSIYIDGVTLDEFIDLSKYFYYTCEMSYLYGKSVSQFKDLLQLVTGRTFSVKDGAWDVLESINFPPLKGQVYEDTFVTDKYYYYKGNCITLKNYSYYNMRNAYREDGKVPQFKTVLSSLERWFD